MAKSISAPKTPGGGIKKLAPKGERQEKIRISNIYFSSLGYFHFWPFPNGSNKQFKKYHFFCLSVNFYTEFHSLNGWVSQLITFLKG